MKLEARVRRVTGRSVNRLATIVDGKLTPGPEFAAPKKGRIEPCGQHFLLLYLDEAGEPFTDGWHATLQEANDQAKFEFEIEEADWVKVEA